MALIKFLDKHAAVFGTTQEGKTYAVTQSLKAARAGVIFMDMKAEPVPGYVRADKQDDLDAIIEVLKIGEKVNYTPSRGTRFAEVAAIIEGILDVELDVYVICDEVHLAYLNPDKQKRAAQAAYEELATVGLSKGRKGVFISQRPALMPNTLMHLADLQVYFRNDELNYLRKYMGDDDANRMRDLLDKGGQYSYVTRYRGRIEGAFKV